MRKIIIVLIAIMSISNIYGQTTAEEYLKRGVSKEKLKDYTGAIADYNKAIELNPNNANAYYSRAVSKMRLGYIDSACLDFSKAGELGHKDAYETIKILCN